MQAGSGARLLAPLALVICAIAVFVVLTSQDDGGSTAEPVSAGSAQSSSASSEKPTSSSSGPRRSSYTVKAGDSFSAIAEAQGVDIATLQELNPDVDPRALQPGQKLKLKE